MLRLFSHFTMWVVFLMLAWMGGLGWFMQSIPSKNADPLPAADCIVLLTGGKGRLETALKLLAEDKGKELFISGAGKQVALADLIGRSSPATQLALRQRFGGKPPVTLGREAENTIGNSEETAKWLAGTDHKSLLLVTSNYHMPRSLNEFRERMPQMQIIPAPVFPEDFSDEGGIQDEQNRALLMSEYHKFIASELRHAYLSMTHKP